MSEQPTVADVVQWLRLVVSPGDVVELRILKCVDNPKYPPFTVSGYFDDDHLDELARVALEWTGRAEGCYVTINPVQPDLLARASNRVVKKPEHTTIDADIVRRVGLVIDADPVRPAGISATDEEKALARERIDRLVSHLTARGWPALILADSGNGFHARYRIDLPTDDGGLVERVLKAADALFSDAQVKIDPKLFNPARIIKLYGTMSRKGDDIPGRPHRWTRVLSIPDDYRVVPVELLEAFAVETETSRGHEAHGSNGKGNGSSGTPVAHDKSSPKARARAYVFAPGFPDSIAGQNGHDRLYHVASVLVDGFGLKFDQALPIFQEWNRDKALPPESDKQVRHKLESAFKKHPVPSLKLLNGDRDNRTGNGNPTGTAAPSAASAGRNPEGLVLVTSRASDYRPEPVEFLDGGVLPKKLITIAGLGGAGKGMLWANVAADLTQGRPTLGMSYQPPGPIDVLLIDCEDGYSDTVIPRLLAADADRNRVHILEGVRDSKGHVQPFSLAYLKVMESYLDAHPTVGLVVIDPITGYIGRAGVKDHHDAELRSVLEPIGELANRRKITILTIKHLNKDESKTVASRVGGSVAYVNVSRACFVVATDPENEMRRVLAPFKWNLNAPRPPSIAWTMEPIAPDHLAVILADCDHLRDADKEKLAGQMHRLVWLGKVDAAADDLLRAAAHSERKSSQNEIERAREWLIDRLADGPVGSVVCAREGDKALGRAWPAPELPPDERRKRVLGRVRWWRETILKPRLQGESHRSGFNGPYFFCLPDHLTRRLWPPTSEAIAAAQQADDRETRPTPEDEPWSAPVEAVEVVEATGRAQDSKVDSTGGRVSRPRDGDRQPRPMKARRRSRRNMGNSTVSTDSTVHCGTERTTEQAENASTDSTGSLGEAEDQPETDLLFCDDDGEYF